MSIGHYMQDEDYESKEKFLSCFWKPDEISRFDIKMVDMITPNGDAWTMMIIPYRPYRIAGRDDWRLGDCSATRDTMDRQEIFGKVCQVSGFLAKMEIPYTIVVGKQRGMEWSLIL